MEKCCCGKEFVKKSYNHKYCSEACRKRNMPLKDPDSFSISKFKIFERDNFKCVYCGSSSIEDGVKLHVDHVIPKSLYFDNNLFNLVTSCEYCNMKKAFKSLNVDVVKRIYKRNVDLMSKHFSEEDIESMIKTFDKAYNEHAHTSKTKAMFHKRHDCCTITQRLI